MRVKALIEHLNLPTLYCVHLENQPYRIAGERGVLHGALALALPVRSKCRQRCVYAAVNQDGGTSTSRASG